ncbi:hypothetical protein [Ilumatobacter sp.]|uniref:hypothetical protein n=1 Tax=Ilumatobacter sp. TaxID=1967498 RepID=UPI003C565232
MTTETAPASTPAETTTTTTTTLAPTTTVDEQAILDEAEAAYLEAFEVGKEVLRNPDDPENVKHLENHFIGANLDVALENLRRTTEGQFIARENDSNPSVATIVEPAEFVDGDPTLARLTVCEFNSDRIFEVGTAPDGGDALRRDDPVSILLTVRMEFVDGKWRSQSGTRGEEIRDETNRCAEA